MAFRLTLLFYFTLAFTLVTGCTDTGTDTEIARSVALIEKQRLRHHIESLTTIAPRSVGHPESLRSTVQYIKTQLSSHAIIVNEEPLAVPGENTMPDNHMVNLIAVFPGSDTDEAFFEIGAHYDTVETTPGADDNASGIAALLEIARVLSGLPNRRTIRLCFFAQEEDRLVGSTRHVSNMNQRNEKPAGTLILEMIAYTDNRPGSQASPARIPLVLWPPDTEDFIAVVGNF